MEGWSTLFTVLAIAAVLLTFCGAWWVVRVLRARKPRPKIHDRSHASRPHQESGR